MRKWEVISEMLDELIYLKEFENYKADLKRAKEIAEQIDKILVEQYGDEQLNENILQLIEQEFDYAIYNKCYKSAVMILYSITISTQLCIACSQSEYECKKCKFAEVVGQCDETNSLYHKYFEIVKLLIKDYLKMNIDELSLIESWFTSYISRQDTTND